MKNFLNTNKEVLEYYGWTEVCQSPREIQHFEGSFASGMAVDYVINGLREEYITEMYDELIDEYKTLKAKERLLNDLKNDTI